MGYPWASAKPETNFYAKPFPPWKRGILDLVSVLSWHCPVFLTSTSLVKHFVLRLWHLWDLNNIYPTQKIAELSHLLFLRHFWRNSCYVAISVDHIIHYFEADKLVRQLKKMKKFMRAKNPILLHNLEQNHYKNQMNIHLLKDWRSNPGRVPKCLNIKHGFGSIICFWEHFRKMPLRGRSQRLYRRLS